MHKIEIFLLIIVFILLGLVGCQTVDAGQSVDVSPVPSATLVDDVVVPSPTAVVSSTAILTPTPTLVSPSLTPTVSPTPFLCPYLRGKMEQRYIESAAMQEKVHYLVHLPPCYADYEDCVFPVLYLFHGWPLDERHWDSLGMDELMDDWISRGLIAPFIIVMPGVEKEGRYVNSSGGDNSFEGMVVNELVPMIDETYNTWRDPQGRAVGGISRGGVWALEIALRHQDVFGSVGAHSPALALNKPMPQYDPFLLVKEGVPDLRIYLDAGDKDWARASTIEFRNLLEELEIDVTYEVHEGGHEDDLWRAGLADYIRYYTETWATFDGACR